MSDFSAILRKPHRLRYALIAAASLLYLLGVNGYFAPLTYDNIVYFFGAKSIATAGGFMFDGKYVFDWPPGFSTLLALPMFLGIESVVVSKLFVVACAAAALVLTAPLLERAQRPSVTATLLLFGLLPSSLVFATRILSEWLYIALSFAFLLALHALWERRSLALALATGALLGAASLTRYIGVLLGVALLVQAVRVVRARHLRAIWPEAVAALVGGAGFILWRLKLAAQLAAGTAVAYYQGSLGFLSHFEPARLLVATSDLLFNTSRLAGILHLAPGVLVLATFPVFALIVFGAIELHRQGKGHPADAYVAATFLLLSFHEVVQPRYLFPVAPFLVGYFLVGVRGVASRLQAGSAFLGPRPAKAALIAWACTFALADLLFLLKGNGRTHHGVSPLVSRTAEDYYMGEWRSLYLASQLVRKGAVEEGTLGLVGSGNRKYVYAFSGQRTVDYPTKEPVRFLMSTEPGSPPEAERTALGLSELGRSGDVTVYRVANPTPTLAGAEVR